MVFLIENKITIIVVWRIIMFWLPNGKAPISQQIGPRSSLSESIFPIKLSYGKADLKVQLCLRMYLVTVLVGQYISEISQSRYDWILRWEGSTLLFKSLYLERYLCIAQEGRKFDRRTDTGSQIRPADSRVSVRRWEQVHSANQSNSRMFRDMWL